MKIHYDAKADHLTLTFRETDRFGHDVVVEGQGVPNLWTGWGFDRDRNRRGQQERRADSQLLQPAHRSGNRTGCCLG